MLISCIISSIARNSDGSFRVTLTSIADATVTFSASLPASEAQNAYIGRAVNVTLTYAP